VKHTHNDKVRNSIGTVVLQAATLDFTAEKTAVLSLATLPEGIYFLTITLQDRQQLSQKVVVQRSGVAN
jgi:accessory gene regulator protein AgrB